MLITASKQTKYGTEYPFLDSKHGIVCDSGKGKQQAQAWLDHRCPVCMKRLAGSSELTTHLEHSHHKQLCAMCVKHRPVFPFEWDLFASQRDLHQHIAQHHRRCTVCSVYYYNDDDLQKHCRERHELCHICTRRSHLSTSYFADYSALEQHFSERHYLCAERLCLDLKFVVFETELEYKAHLTQMHLGGVKLQRSQVRELSRLDNLAFNSTPRAAHASHADEGRGDSRANRKDPVRVHGDGATRAGSTPSDAARASSSANTGPLPLSVDLAKFFFDPKPVADHHQSLMALSEKTDEFYKFLSSYPNRKIDSLHQQTRQVARCRDLVHWMSLSFPPAQVVAIGGKLKELMPDRPKQLEMEAALKEHAEKERAFPALPTTSTSTLPVRGSRKDKEPIRLSGEPVKGRILPVGTPKNAPKGKPAAFSESAVPAATTVASVDSVEQDVFTIGSKAKPEPTSTVRSKGKRGQVVLRFGGFPT